VRLSLEHLTPKELEESSLATLMLMVMLLEELKLQHHTPTPTKVLSEELKLQHHTPTPTRVQSEELNQLPHTVTPKWRAKELKV